MDGGERSAGTIVARFFIAHLVAYPVAIAWVVGSMPFCFPIFEGELSGVSGDVMLWGIAPMPAGAAMIVRATLLVGAVVFVIEHGIGVVWALASDARLGRRRFVLASVALGGVGALGAVVGWIWFWIHYGA